MKTIKSTFLQIVKGKEVLLLLIIIIAILTFIGWVLNDVELASFSSKYKPVSPIVAVTFFILSILLYAKIRPVKSSSVNLLATITIIIITFYYLIVFLNSFFSFAPYIEKIFVRDINKFGIAFTGQISPFASVMIILIGISCLSIRQNGSEIIKYLGGTSSLLVCLVSSVFLIGYLYKSPLNYGGNIIPVSLPATICSILFGVTLLKIYSFQYWTFNLIKDNKISRLLFRTFLPVSVILIFLQDLLDIHFDYNDKNPALGEILLFVVTAVTILIISRISSILGNNLFNAEQKIRENEEKLKFYTDNSPMGVIEWDFDFIVTKWTGEAEKIFGWSSEEVSGKKLMDLNIIYEPDMQIAQETMEKLTNGLNKQVVTCNRNYRKDRTIITCEWYNTVLKNEKGEMASVLSQVLDITKRKKTEEDLVEREIYFRSIFENNSVGICIIEPDTTISMVNYQYCLLSGYKKEEVIGTSWTKQIPPEDLERLKEYNRRRLLDPNGAPDKYEFTFYRKDGEIRHSFISVILLPDKKIIASFSDITDRKQTEKALIDNEIKLSRMNAGKDRFLAILSHDLRSPFNYILGLSDLLATDINGIDKTEIETIAREINKSARNTYNLLEELLVWAKAQEGKIPYNPQQLNFSEICNITLETLIPSAVAKRITISCGPDDKLLVFADPDLLKTVLRNLISNAIKFTNTNGRIDVYAGENSGEVTISVKDNGVGMRPEDKVKLFDISQVLTTEGTAKESGTGLGLFLCKEFVEKHGGRIWVESEVAKGSTFRFTLPLKKWMQK